MEESVKPCQAITIIVQHSLFYTLLSILSKIENPIFCVAFFAIISTALSSYSFNKSTTFKYNTFDLLNEPCVFQQKKGYYPVTGLTFLPQFV